MARDHARIQLAIWKNDDWRGLSRDAQHMYFVLLSQPTLSYCGVMDWWPNRLSLLSHDTDEADVFAAIKELMDSDFVWLDVATSELLVRTYVRHDGVMQRSNMGKAVARALDRVASIDITHKVLVELSRLHREEPSLAGWHGFKDATPEAFTNLSTMASGM